MLRSLATVHLTPELDTPSYTVLRATSDYEASPEPPLSPLLSPLVLEVVYREHS